MSKGKHDHRSLEQINADVARQLAYEAKIGIRRDDGSKDSDGFSIGNGTHVTGYRHPVHFNLGEVRSGEWAKRTAECKVNAAKYGVTP